MLTIEFKEFQYRKKNKFFINVMINAIVFDTIRPESRYKLCVCVCAVVCWIGVSSWVSKFTQLIAMQMHAYGHTKLEIYSLQGLPCNADVSCMNLQVIQFLKIISLVSWFISNAFAKMLSTILFWFWRFFCFVLFFWILFIIFVIHSIVITILFIFILPLNVVISPGNWYE